MGIICKIRGHTRDARRAWHDRLDWRSSCIRCDAPRIKDEAANSWRTFNLQKDFSTRRTGKPER